MEVSFSSPSRLIPSLDQNYTLFGQCDDPSVEVVKAIAGVPRDDNDKPLSPVTLEKVTIVPEGQALPALQPGEPAAPPAPQPASAPGSCVGTWDCRAATIAHRQCCGRPLNTAHSSTYFQFRDFTQEFTWH